MNIRVCRLSPALLAGNGSAEQIFNINPQCRVTAAKEIAELSVELQTKVREDFNRTRAFSWLKAPTNAFTIKTLC